MCQISSRFTNNDIMSNAPSARAPRFCAKAQKHFLVILVILIRTPRVATASYCFCHYSYSYSYSYSSYSYYYYYMKLLAKTVSSTDMVLISLERAFSGIVRNVKKFRDFAAVS